MTLMTSVEFQPSAQLDTLDEMLARAVASGAQSLLVLACDQDEWGSSHSTWLRNLPLPVFGGVFPVVLHSGIAYDSGTLVVGLQQAPNVHVIEGVSRVKDWEEEFHRLSIYAGNNNTVITIVDGLSKNIERIIEQLYVSIGDASNAMGCGAGSLSFMQKPCVISSQGLLEDAALIAVLPKPCGLGVNHGWDIFAGPYLVTEAQGNCIHTLNYQPALEVYSKAIEEKESFNFSDHAFFEIAKTHPFGISSVDGELLVRDPIAVDGQSLVCVGEVPQNSTVYLLKGIPTLLIEASGEASRAAVAQAQSVGINAEAVSAALIFDCISRSLFLSDHFKQELKTLQLNLPAQCKNFGALTLGEICTSSAGPITLLNKSTVVAVF